MTLYSLLLAAVFVFQDLPYKPESEYAIRVDLKFKPRPTEAPGKVDLSETREEYEKRNSTTPLPYLVLFLTVKESPNDESRIRLVRDGKQIIGNRKIEPDKEIKIEVGFTDDAKDKVSGYEHIVYFMNEDKKERSRIVITIEPNGDYLINGEKRGRF